MAFELHRGGFPGIAASNILPKQVVQLAAGAVERGFIPVASNNDRPFGITHATALRTEGVTVHEEHSVAKAIAVASVGVGAAVGHASANGALGPVVGASGITRYAVGYAVNAAAAGETLSVYVKPHQLSNLI